MKSIYYYFGALSFVLVSMSANSDDNGSNKVRKLVQEKEIVSLESLMTSIRRHGNWTLLEIELEEEDDKLIYEVELLDGEGQVHEIRYNAKTGQELDRSDD
ncbi:MAG: PepSY domain-containing protein [Gammaproteobacteria bacterium]|nr:PepSY domain-containing protein [Gammaproteobacteria bacterium]